MTDEKILAEEERAMLVVLAAHPDGCMTDKELGDGMKSLDPKWSWPPWIGFRQALNRLIALKYVDSRVPAGWLITALGKQAARPASEGE
jgi:hypothetical protein